MKSEFKIKDNVKKLFGKFRKEEDAENTVGNKADGVPDSEEMPEYSDSTLNDKIDKNDKKDEKLMAKVGEFFNYEPQKQKVLRHEDFKGVGDVYYASVSAIYKIAERVLWLFLAVFMTFTIATNYQEITYSNFFYLIRDFSTAAESQASNYQILSYDANGRQSFDLYRGGVVSASPSTLSIFTASGRRTLKNSNEYNSPNLICCDKYVLIYDTAGSAFSVYNSFSKVYSDKLQNQIVDACFNKDGAFALATRGDDGRTVIMLYDKDIKLRGATKPDPRYVFDVSLSSRNSHMASLYYEEGTGIGDTVIAVYEIGSKQSAKTFPEIRLEGEFPVRCGFLENGKLAVITNKSIRLYEVDISNDKFNEITNISFNGAKLNAFCASDSGAAVAVSDGASKKVFAFDKNGKEIYNSVVNDNVSDIGVCEGYIFMKTITGVVRLDTWNKQSNFLPCEGSKMLIYGEDTAIVCGDARAEYLVFGK